MSNATVIAKSMKSWTDYNNMKANSGSLAMMLGYNVTMDFLISLGVEAQDRAKIAELINAVYTDGFSKGLDVANQLQEA
jgi:hypothetical protein